MNNQPLFSILVANYNNGHFFKDCYESLINQTFTDWECIIVDDCSTDNSVELITNLIYSDNRFKLFQNKQNKGVGYTKKRCIDLAEGDYCGFVDPDDAIREDSLDIVANYINIYLEYSIYYSNFVYSDENLGFQRVRKTRQVEENDNNFFNINGQISHLAIFNRENYIKTEGLNTKMKRAIDQDLYLKLYDISRGKVFYIDEDLYYYRIHSNGISTNTNSEKARFWHWVAIIKAAERRKINVEDLFIENFVDRTQYDILKHKISLLKKSRFLKLLNKLGLFKAYKYL